MKISILNGQVITGNDLSRKWAEVIELSQEDGNKLQAKTHRFDIETKELVEIPQPEPEPIPEPTEEQLREEKITEMEKIILRRQALEELWEDTQQLESKILEMKGVERK